MLRIQESHTASEIHRVLALQQEMKENGTISVSFYMNSITLILQEIEKLGTIFGIPFIE